MKITRTVSGFQVAANGSVAEFVFGETSDHHEEFGLSRALDVGRWPDGTFEWRGQAANKLRQLGLWAPYTADGSAQTKPLPDPRQFLIAAGILEAPAPKPKASQDTPPKAQASAPKQRSPFHNARSVIGAAPAPSAKQSSQSAAFSPAELADHVNRTMRTRPCN